MILLLKNKQSGFTLVEVIASILIITIILISFFTFFINTAKTTKTSNDIFDATYYAQKEMEKIYNLSQTNIVPKSLLINEKTTIIDSAITQNPFNGKPEYAANKDYYYTKNSNSFVKKGNSITDPNDIYFYVLKFDYYDEGKNLTRFIINIYDRADTVRATPKAKMESILEWRAR